MSGQWHCLSHSFSLSVWSWTLSSRRTSCSRWWGGCAQWRTHPSPRCLTLRRPTPPRPNARPKPRPRNTHAGNCGSSKHTALQDTRTCFHIVPVFIFLLPRLVSFCTFYHQRKKWGKIVGSWTLNLARACIKLKMESTGNWISSFSFGKAEYFGQLCVKRLYLKFSEVRNQIELSCCKVPHLNVYSKKNQTIIYLYTSASPLPRLYI